MYFLKPPGNLCTFPMRLWKTIFSSHAALKKSSNTASRGFRKIEKILNLLAKTIYK
jgi:hypothetical protein